MTEAVIYTALIPVSLLLVIGLVVLSGSLSVARRRLLERAVILAVFPAAATLWTWRGVQAWLEGDWVWVVGSVLLVVVSGLSCARMWRRPLHTDGTRS